MLDRLAEEGVILSRHIAYKICAPSRSSLHSGRLPVHVNTVNVAQSSYNSADPVSGFAGIPRNMTGLGVKLRDAGYRTHFYGKFDIGMATPDHSPLGRGYESSLVFFHHANNYYSSGVEFKATGELNACMNRFVDLFETNASYRGGYTELPNLQALAKAAGDDETAYVENIFRRKAVEAIRRHDPTLAPLFLSYAFHLVHTPLQVPRAYVARVDAMLIRAGAAPFDTQGRRIYAAMTLYMDDVVADLEAALKVKAPLTPTTCARRLPIAACPRLLPARAHATATLTPSFVPCLVSSRPTVKCGTRLCSSSWPTTVGRSTSLAPLPISRSRAASTQIGTGECAQSPSSLVEPSRTHAVAPRLMEVWLLHRSGCAPHHVPMSSVSLPLPPDAPFHRSLSFLASYLHRRLVHDAL